MTNYKALGIEKEMNEVFEHKENTNLKLLFETDYYENPLINRRKENQYYCNIYINKCSNESWWYNKLIGFQFFCRVYIGKLPNGIEYVIEYKGVKLTRTKEIIFRGFDPNDVVMC